MNKQLNHFFDKTKELHVLLSIALLLIIIIIVAPISNRLIKYSGQLIIIAILMYILFKNFMETYKFTLVQKQMEKKKLKNKGKWKGDMTDDVMIDIKNNTVASYVLCGFIFLLLLYVIYSAIV